MLWTVQQSLSEPAFFSSFPNRNGSSGGIHVVTCELSAFLIYSSCTDVNSWLVTFGFHLHNTIPGFPVPKFDLSMPSYELSKSQRWDDLPVGTTNISHAYWTQTPVFYSSSRQTLFFWKWTGSDRHQNNCFVFHCSSLMSEVSSCHLLIGLLCISHKINFNWAIFA